MQGRLGTRTALTLALAAATLLCAAQAAVASSTSFEAERLSVPRTSGRVLERDGASGGAVLRLTGRAAATGRMTVGSPSRLSVRVRGSSCSGAPRILVTVGGERVLSTAVKGTASQALRASSTIASGRRAVSVKLANPRRAGGCRRALEVDRLVVTPTTGAPTSVATGPVVAGAPGLAPAPGAWWVPAQRTTWQWQLTGTPDLTVDAQMYDLDLFNTTAETVAALHAAGRRAVCYVSAGSYEPRRPDAAALAGVRGAELVGWPGEYWLDVRRLDVLLPVMAARLDLCAAKGFDGVEFDNVDAYANTSGFALTDADQIAYDRALARLAHDRGLSAGLKNTLGLLGVLAGDFDWAFNEECYDRGECGALQAFAAAGKAVFIAEYALPTSSFCAAANAAGYMAMRKNVGLDAFREPCWA